MKDIPLFALVDGDGRLEAGSSSATVAWWSFTKTLIAAAVLKLAERGAIALDAPWDGHTFTVRQALRHRAGIPNYGRLAAYHAAAERGDPPWTDEDLFARTPPDDLLFPPDQGWAYSNIGYLLLRRLLERTCSKPLDAVLRDLIFMPVGVTQARVAQSAADMASLELPPPYPYDPGWVFHGCVIGPASEAALVLHRLLTSDILSDASRAALLDRQRPGGALAGRPWTSTAYGTGLMIGTVDGPLDDDPLLLAGHTGAGPGSVCAIYHAVEGGAARTVAAFMGGNDDGPVEGIVAREIATG